MAAGMNAELLAQEMLDAIGGRVTRDRRHAFQKLAAAIVRHIQINMIVTSSGADPQGGVVTSTSTIIL